MKYKDKYGIPLTLNDEIMDPEGWIYVIVKVGRKYIGKRIDCKCRECQVEPWWVESKNFQYTSKIDKPPANDSWLSHWGLNIQGAKSEQNNNDDL